MQKSVSMDVMGRSNCVEAIAEVAESRYNVAALSFSRRKIRQR